ncbi:hypothetical protein HDU96_002161 [Phlyctochytrium bullatum]|nr:hypothetical protein HDU96_002161 [Phlyctochytrium bullatum]
MTGTHHHATGPRGLSPHTVPSTVQSTIDAVHHDPSLVTFADPLKAGPRHQPPHKVPKDLAAEVSLAHADPTSVHLADPAHDGPRAHPDHPHHAHPVAAKAADPYAGPRHLPPHAHAPVDHSKNVSEVDVAHAGPRHLPPHAHKDASLIDHSKIGYADPAHAGPRAH